MKLCDGIERFLRSFLVDLFVCAGIKFECPIPKVGKNNLIITYISCQKLHNLRYFHVE